MSYKDFQDMDGARDDLRDNPLFDNSQVGYYQDSRERDRMHQGGFEQ
jgi:hypothetical protein